jgi:hypothetical protein
VVQLARLLTIWLVGIVFAAAGVAVAGNFASDHQVDYFAPGAHQFYVWCPGGTDSSATAKGMTAEDAQLSLYKSIKTAGRLNCWPIWQGRVAQSVVQPN